MIKPIKVAIAGVGNCASSLVQGVEFYRRQKVRNGLLHVKIGPYNVYDMKFVAAFDIDSRKVGQDLSNAIFAEPNNARKIIQPPKTGVKVQMSQPLDGVSPVAGEKIIVDNSKPAKVSRVLEESDSEILVNLTPTGASKVSEMFANESLKANCAMINATPSRIASHAKWRSKYRSKNLPLVGDDVMDQIGSTVLHRNLLGFLVERGVRVSQSYQLDIGGGTESQMALDKKRYEIKRNIKTAAVAAVVPYKFPLVAGSSDFVDFMQNRRTSYFSIDAEYFGATGFTLDMRILLEDGPACAGTLTDVIRFVKLAIDNEDDELVDLSSAFGFKAPPKMFSEETLKQRVVALTRGTKAR